MISISWIEKNTAFLTGRMGIYRLDAGDNFFFDPTPGFYGFISQGTTAVLNEAMRILADHIESKTCPVIEEWKGSSDPLVRFDYDWTNDETPPGLIRYSAPNHSRVELNITHKHSPFLMGAILAHELTHHFLDTKGIQYETVKENERLTDLATVYLGLGKLTLNGYERISWTQWRKIQGTVRHSYKIGYLSVPELAIILHHICNFRSISLEAVKQNLSDNALQYIDRVNKRINEYDLKKSLMGERPCPHCGALAQFSFSEENDGLYCSLCGWEWEDSLRYAFKKNLPFLDRIRNFFRRAISLSPK